MSHSSKKVIYYAAVANFGIAIAKFGGAWLTGSAAMMSEGIHSLVDTSNQGLLLLGMKKASKPADAKHPSGYGRELYFYAFIVAILIFAVGAGVSLLEGVEALMHGKALLMGSVAFVGFNIGYQYIVLGILFFGMLLEGKSWLVAYQEFTGSLPNGVGVWKGLTDVKDPTVAVILVEDTAAMLGLFVAFIGVGAAYYFNNSLLDAGATIIIGVILASVSMFLAYECKSLLIGEAASPEVQKSIADIISEMPGVIKANEVITEHIGPKEVRVLISLDFKDSTSSTQIEAISSRLEKQIKKKHVDVTRVFVEAQSSYSHARDAETEAAEHNGLYG